MNKERRKEIASIIEELTSLQERITYVCDEEQEAYDNLPEGIQASAKGCQMEDNAGELSQASDSVGDAIDILSGIE